MGPASPSRPPHLRIGKNRIGLRCLTLWLACVVSFLAGNASAHDASSYGGLFRSRDLGAAWLNADVGLFLNAALVIAVDPRDSSHLLVGTDLGILSSRNAGRSWVPEAHSSSARCLRWPSRHGQVVRVSQPSFHRTGRWRRAGPRSAVRRGRGPVKDRSFARRPAVREQGGGRTYAAFLDSCR